MIERAQEAGRLEGGREVQGAAQVEVLGQAWAAQAQGAQGMAAAHSPCRIPDDDRKGQAGGVGVALLPPLAPALPLAAPAAPASPGSAAG